MKNISRRLLKSIVFWFGKHICCLLISTLRYDRKTCLPISGAIICTLHEEILPIIGHLKKTYQLGHETVALSSMHKDGDYGVWIAKKHNIQTVRGSSNRGGTKALLQLLQIIKQQPSRNIAITVDGPRGPRRKVKPGAILLAKRSGQPLQILRCQYRHKRIEKSWDKHKIPYPFAKVSIDYSEPIKVSRKDKVEDIQQQLNNLLGL